MAIINLLFCSSFARPCHCLLRPLQSRFYLSCHCEAMSFTFMAAAISPLHYNGDKDPFSNFPQSQRQKGIKTINRIASSGCALLAMTDQRKVELSLICHCERPKQAKGVVRSNRLTAQPVIASDRRERGNRLYTTSVIANERSKSKLRAVSVDSINLSPARRCEAVALPFTAVAISPLMFFLLIA